MEDYRQHVASASFIIKLIEFIVGIFCGLGFAIVLVICTFNDLWRTLWVSLLVIPCSGLFLIMLLELGRHVFMSFALKTDYYEPSWPGQAKEETKEPEERFVTVTDPNAPNQNNDK